MRFQFIHKHRKVQEISLMCQVFGVSQSGFYSWLSRPESKRSLANKEIVGHLKEIHRKSRRTYGAMRALVELQERGIQCGIQRVRRLRKENDIWAKQKRKFRVTTDSNHNLPVAKNLLNREFSVPQPNLAWVSDISYVWTMEGWLYLATVMDLFSRKIVGWSMGPRMTRHLVIDTLEMACKQRSPSIGLIAHSDRGSQYASKDYQRLMDNKGIQCSMSRKGDCWDNSPMESFFNTLKTELVYHEIYRTREQAKQSIFEFIEVFYNRERKHSALGYTSPEEFERLDKVA